jgi:hypothetical protein
LDHKGAVVFLLSTGSRRSGKPSRSLGWLFHFQLRQDNLSVFLGFRKVS